MRREPRILDDLTNIREDSVANQVGKRYQCGKCNSEMIVTKAGDGALSCCGVPMQQKS